MWGHAEVSKSVPAREAGAVMSLLSKIIASPLSGDCKERL
jgi:hypothetical protein